MGNMCLSLSVWRGDSFLACWFWLERERPYYCDGMLIETFDELLSQKRVNYQWPRWYVPRVTSVIYSNKGIIMYYVMHSNNTHS